MISSSSTPAASDVSVAAALPISGSTSTLSILLLLSCLVLAAFYLRFRLWNGLYDDDSDNNQKSNMTSLEVPTLAVTTESTTAGNRFSTSSLSSTSTTNNTTTNNTLPLPNPPPLHHRASFGPGSAHPKRRGYVRPQGTDFAASARSRESVLSLGSIAHLQHYFARTGLLDIKGNLRKRQQLQQRRQTKAHTLDFSQLGASSSFSDQSSSAASSASSASSSTSSRSVSMCSSSQRTVSGTSMTSCSDVDSAYASMKGASPDRELGVITPLVESPIQENYPDHHHNNNNISDYDDNYGDDEDDDWSEGDEVFEDPDPSVMLPPTVSTYMHREKPVPRPPSQAVLQAELVDCLGHARNALDQTEQESDPARADAAVAVTASSGWHEIQGMHILDVLTLAIRAAKVYYTSHDRPDRLDAIKSERAVRTELLAVMDVLKRMATRRFAGGVRPDEIRDLRKWLDSLDAMLAQEAALAAAERQARAGWTWLESANANANIPSSSSSSSSSSCQRERAFLQSMLAAAIPEDRLESASVELPPWIPLDQLASPSDSVFLRHMQSGVRLVQLHNCAVRTSRRRFGAIAAFHADTQKPYRAAENLRYWHKAAELRWEVLLPPIDALAIARASSESVDPAVWQAFEKALLCWCRAVREEITAEVQSS